MRYFLLALAAWHALATLVAIVMVGKPRKPSTPGAVAVIVMIEAAVVTALIFAAGRFS